MQLLWHYLVNLSFGYLGLIAMVRITQEVKSLAPAAKRVPPVKIVGTEDSL